MASWAELANHAEEAVEQAVEQASKWKPESFIKDLLENLRKWDYSKIFDSVLSLFFWDKDKILWETKQETSDLQTTISASDDLFKWVELWWIDDFNYSKYAEVISSKLESWSAWYNARNDESWKERWVKPAKWAFWKYQFTVETLIDYWVAISIPPSEKDIQSFLKNHSLQEDVMKRYTYTNLKKLKKNQEFAWLIESWDKEVWKALAAWHLWWYWWLMKYMKGGKWKDWMGTSIASYTDKFSDHYNA